MEQPVWMSDLLTRREAAGHLRIAEVTLGRWSKGEKPRIPCVQVGSKVMYHQADLDEFLRKNRRG